MRALLRALFVPADRTYPCAWWCPACSEAHYAAMQPGWKKAS